MELAYRHVVAAIVLAFILKNSVFYDVWVIYNTPEKETRLIDDDTEEQVIHKVLITGASKGIGAELAYQYARQGAQIVITARSAGALEQVVKKCKSLGAKSADFIAADMNVEKDVSKVIPFAKEKMNGLDILVLNHIYSIDGKPFIKDTKYLRTTMQVNFHSFVSLTIDGMKMLDSSPISGRVIVVSTAGTAVGVPHIAPYLASKHALRGLYNSWRQELLLKKSNVTITFATLGYIATETGTTTMNKLYGDRVAVTPTSAADTANVIMRAGLSRVPDICYPYYNRILFLLRDWIPSSLENGVRSKARVFS